MNIAALDLNLLKVFEALYAERNVTRAGERIGLAQSSMSNALNRLRYVFKDELFVRTPSEMRPTPFAHDLAPRVEHVLEEVRSLLGSVETFDPSTAQATVKICSSDNLKILMVPRLMAHLAEKAPLLSIRMRTLDKDRIFAELDDGRADIAIGTFGDVPKRAVAELLFEDSFTCLARHNHPKLKRGMSIRQFAAIPHALVTLRDDATGLVDELLAQRGLRRRVGITVDQFSIIPSIVASTDYLAMCPKSIARHLIKDGLCKSYDPPLSLPSWPVQIVTSRRSYSDPLVSWMVTALSESLRDVGEAQ